MIMTGIDSGRSSQSILCCSSLLLGRMVLLKIYDVINHHLNFTATWDRNKHMTHTHTHRHTPHTTHTNTHTHTYIGSSQSVSSVEQTSSSFEEAKDKVRVGV